MTPYTDPEPRDRRDRRRTEIATRRQSRKDARAEVAALQRLAVGRLAEKRAAADLADDLADVADVYRAAPALLAVGSPPSPSFDIVPGSWDSAIPTPAQSDPVTAAGDHIDTEDAPK